MNTVTNIKHDTLYITQCTTMAYGSNGKELEAKLSCRLDYVALWSCQSTRIALLVT